jgi:hypothetical protein
MIVRPQNFFVQISRRVSKYAEFYADFISREKVENFSPKESNNAINFCYQE